MRMDKYSFMAVCNEIRSYEAFNKNDSEALELEHLLEKLPVNAVSLKEVYMSLQGESLRQS